MRRALPRVGAGRYPLGQGGKAKGLRATLAAAIVTGLLNGAAAVATAQSPAPTASTEVAGGFIRPFEYAIPVSMEPSGYARERRVWAVAESPSGTAFGSIQYDAHETGARGVLVADVTDAFAHPCPGVDGGRSRVEVGDGSAAFLDDMVAIAGLSLDDRYATSFDGRPAVSAASTSASACETGDIHIEGMGSSFDDWIDLDVPSRLVVTEIDGRTILVQAWAGSEHDLVAWLPIADEFIDSIHFLEPEPAEGVTPSGSAAA